MDDNLAARLRLMLVTDDRLMEGRDLVATCHDAVQGGVTCVQLRLKRVPPRELIAAARALDRSSSRCRSWSTIGSTWRSPRARPAFTSAPTICRWRWRDGIVPAGFWIGASVGTPGEGRPGTGCGLLGDRPVARQ
jgi:hypothetical protein